MHVKSIIMAKDILIDWLSSYAFIVVGNSRKKYHYDSFKSLFTQKKMVVKFHSLFPIKQLIAVSIFLSMFRLELQQTTARSYFIPKIPILHLRS